MEIFTKLLIAQILVSKYDFVIKENRGPQKKMADLRSGAEKRQDEHGHKLNKYSKTQRMRNAALPMGKTGTF